MIKIKQECILGRFIWTLLRVCTCCVCFKLKMLKRDC